MPDTLHAQTDKQIFVSYSRADRDKVIALYENLQKLDFRLWRDLHELRGGDKFWERIKEAIDASETVVLCMSPAALASKYVRAEWLYARQIGRRVIPVVIEDIDFDSLPRWMSSVDWKDFRAGKPERDLIWSNFIHTLNLPHTPQKVSFMVEAPPFDYVPRPDVVEPIIASLENPANKLMALKGAGGYGKTTLARVICHDERVRTAYDDGTLWVTLGEAVSEEERIAKLLDLVVELRGERPPVQTLEAAKNELRTAIGDRYLLLVVDDAWRRPDLESFLVDAPNAAVLVTTRVRTALPDKTLIHDIDAMQRDQAVKLLAFDLPEEQVARQHKQLDDLAKRLGEWALMLKLTNGALKSLVSAGDSLESALQYVEEGLTEEGLSLAFADDEKGRHATATASLTLSLRLLDVDELKLYSRLAIFPEDVDVPLTVVEILWESSSYKTRTFALKLFNYSLLLNVKDGMLRMHDIVRTHLRETEADKLAEMNASFLDRMQMRYKTTHWRDLPKDVPYLWQHLAMHLIDAGRVDTLRDLLFDFDWMYAKLNATDPAALLADAVTAKAQYPDDPELRLIESALRLAQYSLIYDRNQFANQIRGRLWIYKDKYDLYRNISYLWNSVPDIFGTLALLPTQQFPPMDQAGGPLLRTLMGHTEGVVGALQLDNRHILSWSHDATLRLWRDDGTPLKSLNGHIDSINGVIQLESGEILSWSRDKTLRLWSDNGISLRELIGHTDNVIGALELDNGNLISWSGADANHPRTDDNDIRLWNFEGKILALMSHQGGVNGVLQLADGRILSWSDDTTLRLWANDGTTLAILSGHSQPVKGAMILSSGRILSWSDDTTLRLWSGEGTPLTSLVGHISLVKGALELQNNRILSWSDDTTLRLWSADGICLGILTAHKRSVRGATILHNGRILSWSKGATHLWSNDGTLQTTLAGPTFGVRGAINFSERSFLTWADDMNLRLWEEDGTELGTLKGHTGGIRSAIILSNKYILSWSRDNTLRMWNPTDITSVISQGHVNWVQGLLKLSNSRILSWSHDATLRLWAEDGTLHTILEGHTRGVEGATELSDGRLLSWSADHSLRLWTKEGDAIDILGISYDADQYREDKSKWEQRHHIRFNENIIDKVDTTVDRKSHHLIFDASTGGSGFVRFIGDSTFFTDPIVVNNTFLIAIGDAAGRVIFLKVVPPEE